LPCAKRFYGSHIVKNDRGGLAPNNLHYPTILHEMMESIAFDVFCNNKLGGFKVTKKWVICQIHEAL